MSGRRSVGFGDRAPDTLGDRARAAVIGERDEAGTAAVRARVVWSGLAEPGDAVAGLLVAGLGPARALQLVFERTRAERIVDELLDEGEGEGEGERERESAHRSVRGDPGHGAGPEADGWLVAPDAESALGSRRSDPERTRLVAAVRAAERRWEPRLVGSGASGADVARAANAALDAAAAVGARLVVPGDPAWPSGLDDLGVHAPFVLWVRGDLSALGQARGDARSGAIAVVGSRANTAYGEDVTASIVSGLADAGRGIVSGGAYGIDAVAHRVALAAEAPTIAVLAGGIDRLYPAGNAELLRRVIANGVVVAECPCGVVPSRWRFLQRNRLIAAMTVGTVVVEAGIRSGALNTAHHAGALGRPVGAVPGAVTATSSAGCHELIRERRAELVATAEDLLALLGDDQQHEDSGGRGADPGRGGPSGTVTRTATATEASSADAGPGSAHGRGAREDPRLLRILDALGTRRGVPTDEVARRAGLGLTETEDALALAELEGHVERVPTGWRIPTRARR